MARTLRKRPRHWSGLFVAAAMTPALLVAWESMAQEEQEKPERPEPPGAMAAPPPSQAAQEAKKKLVKKIAVDPTVLINVTAREMPASPDVLNLGKKSTRALERCLSDNVDAGIRSRCAVMLAALGDASALPALQGALDAWEPNVRYQVIRALERIPSESSFAPLMKLYRRGDEETPNAVAILGALGAMSSHKAVKVLREELKKKPDKEKNKPDLREHAFRGLWMTRHLMDRRTLAGDVAYALGSDHQALVLAATEASAELREASLVGPLSKLIEHQDADIRNKAVYALGRIGDRKATRALLDQLPKVRESRMLNNIAFALERLDPKAFFPAVEGLIAHKQAIMRLNAAFVLGDVRRPEGREMLEKALADPSDYVKTSAIAGLGKLRLPASAPTLERYVADENPSVRQEAIYALHEVSGKKKNDLIYSKLFESKLPHVRDRAAIALARSGDTRIRDHVLTCFEQERCGLGQLEPYFLRDKHPSVRERLLVDWTRGSRELTDVIGKLRPNGASAIATASAEAAFASKDLGATAAGLDLAGDVADASVKDRLKRIAGTEDSRLWLHAGVTLARLGDHDVDQRLLSALETLPAEWLPEYVAALGRIREPEVWKRLTTGLEQRTKDKSPDIALAAAAVLLAWDPDNAVFRFLDALSAPSARERTLGARYLGRELKSKRGVRIKWLLRRALARESRAFTRDRLRLLLDGKR